LPDLPLRRRLLSVLARWRADPNLGRAVSDKATIYVDVTDERGRRMIESGGGFNPDCVAMWRQLLARDRWTHIVDVGANYGEMLVNVDLPSTARVIAVEPNPRVLPYLERTLRKAGVRVELVRKAVADRIGTAPLRLDLVWSGTSGLAEAGEVAPDARYELTSVPTTTLAALIADGGQTSRIRALVKIDVEGHEPQVLQGVMDIVGALARFEALAEIDHLSPDQLRWVCDRFDVELYERATRAFVRVEPATAERLTELVASGRYYPHDAVLIPKPTATVP
jgi:FkbM family methyltransferase